MGRIGDFFFKVSSSAEEEKNGEESKKHDRFEIEKEFANTTSFNGIFFWANSRNNVQRIFWIILVLGLMGGMVQQVVTRILAYYEYKASTDISRSFVSGIEFPAVTLCNFNRFFEQESNEELLAMHVLNRVSSPEFMIFATSNNYPVLSERLDYYKNYTNFTMTSYTNSKGWQLRDGAELLHCSFQSLPCNASNFTPVITSAGKCYTFNADVNTTRRQSVPGANGGLFVIVNVRNYEYTEEPVFGIQEAGLKFQVHSKYQPSNVKQFGASVPVGTKGYAQMYRKDTKLMHKPWGKCDPENQKSLQYFSNYSLVACMLECYTADLIERCGCRTFDQYWAASFAPECTTQQMKNCSSLRLFKSQQEFTPESCGCTIPCTFSEYPIRMTYSHVPSYPVSQYYASLPDIPSPDYVKENIVALDISFEEIGYTKEEQSQLVEASSLVSDVGGQLGLWIGISFVTLAEVLQYLFFRIKALFCVPVKVAKKVQEKKRSSKFVNGGFEASEAWMNQRNPS